jgi:hypothetical protein
LCVSGVNNGDIHFASKPDGIQAIGLGRIEPKTLALIVWIYCIGWWFIQDASKVATYWILQRYNVFGINDTLMINKGNNAVDEEGGSTSKKSDTSSNSLTAKLLDSSHHKH